MSASGEALLQSTCTFDDFSAPRNGQWRTRRSDGHSGQRAMEQRELRTRRNGLTAQVQSAKRTSDWRRGYVCPAPGATPPCVRVESSPQGPTTSSWTLGASRTGRSALTAMATRMLRTKARYATLVASLSLCRGVLSMDVISVLPKI